MLSCRLSLEFSLCSMIAGRSAPSHALKREAASTHSLQVIATGLHKSHMIDQQDPGLSRVLIISTRPDGIITGFNSAADRLLGVNADAVVGQVTPVAFHDPEELRRRGETLATQSGSSAQHLFGVIVARAGIGRMAEDEWTYRDRSGYRFPVLLSVSAIPDEAGNILGYCFVAKDRRGQLQAEALLRRQAKLLDLANDAILVRDLLADTITYWNEGAVRLYGWTAEEALGAYTHDFLSTNFPLPSEDIKKKFLEQGLWRGKLVHETRSGR